jgi:hypothetical protein
MTTKHDDGLEWLRAIRRKMAARFGHDPKKAVAYYQKMQRRYAARLYQPDRETHLKRTTPAWTTTARKMTA